MAKNVGENDAVEEILKLARPALAGVAAVGLLSIAQLESIPDELGVTAANFALALPMILTSYGLSIVARVYDRQDSDGRYTEVLTTLVGTALILTGLDFAVQRLEIAAGPLLAEFYRAFVALGMVTVGTISVCSRRASKRRGAR